MWIMDVLGIIPPGIFQFITHGVMISGVVLFVLGIVAKRIPPIANYGLALGLLSMILLLSGSYLEGFSYSQSIIKNEIADLKIKIADAVEKSNHVNVQIVTQVDKETQVVHDVQTVIKTQIQTAEPTIDKDCTVDPEAINILNEAATNTVSNNK